MRLALRVIWLSVVPVPKNKSGENSPKIFCYLYHNGQWLFCCDYEDYEKQDKFSFEDEIKWLKLATQKVKDDAK